MSDTENPAPLRSGEARAAWRSYFQAALTGMLAAGEVDARSAGVAKVIVEACGRVADAAIAEEERRQSKGGVGGFVA